MNYSDLSLSEKLYVLMFVKNRQFSGSNFSVFTFALLFELLDGGFIYLREEELYMTPPQSSYNEVYDVCLNMIRGKGRKLNLSVFLHYVRKNRKLILELTRRRLIEKNIIKVSKKKVLVLTHKEYFMKDTDLDFFNKKILEDINSEIAVKDKSSILIMLLSRLRLFTSLISRKFKQEEIFDYLKHYEAENNSCKIEYIDKREKLVLRSLF